MTTDELTAEVTDLEHYLFDIWKYDELHDIGRLFNLLYLDREPGDARQRQLARDGSADLQRTLANSYQCALLQIDIVVPNLGVGAVVDALLEKLRDRVGTLAAPDGAYFQWLERTWQPPDEDDQFATEVDNATGLRMRIPPDDPREHFAFVSRDFSFYVNKVVEHIDLYRQRGSRSTVQLSAPQVGANRIAWTCSTAVYVHLVKELLTKGYINAPDMNAKEGEANITELFRRLSQAIILKGRDGTSELPPDELQRRFQGRELATAKAARLTLPSAKEVK